MCGIIGYIGYRAPRDVLMDGLTRLEYRGYDSAGLVWWEHGRMERVRAVGNLDSLRTALASRPPTRSSVPGTVNVGIGHTRWATHGAVTVNNAHPHSDGMGRIWIVMNGIIENYAELRTGLERDLVEFSSETDAEVLAHLIGVYYDGDLLDAVRRARRELVGHYAFAAISAEEPRRLVALRQECPLVIGRGEGEQFVASSIAAFLPHTRSVDLLRNGEIADVFAESVSVTDTAGLPHVPVPTEVDWDEDRIDKDGFETFMLKEIYEQADAVAATIGERAARGVGIDLGDLGAIDDELLRTARRVVIVACGTSYHAGLIGRYAIEEFSRLPVEVEIASEYRYRNPVVGSGDVVIGISQSGETADTLAAMRTARERGAKVLAITNIMGSQATREADGVLYTRAGLEIGVAATKTFVSQVVALYLFALRLAELRETLDGQVLWETIGEVKRLPHRITEMFERDMGGVEAIADRVSGADFFLYLGRHVGLPVALEGALKLKEISYIATDAYAAGEMKHGPIALLDQSTPVVVVATESPVLEKVISNIQEVRARGASVIAVATEGDTEIAEHADAVIEVPRTQWMLAPLLAVIPLQLLAYHIARRRGLNVDQPRNLAKTVTVE
jgi:glutamine---fructose-6-phosphate transaminase (isomerizing)